MTFISLIGMRINKWWKPDKRAAGPSGNATDARGLASDPSSGSRKDFRSHRQAHLRTVLGGPLTIWRTLWRPPRHLPAWTQYNRRMKACRGDVGIWHETFLVPAGPTRQSTRGCPGWGRPPPGGWPRLSGLVTRFVPELAQQDNPAQVTTEAACSSRPSSWSSVGPSRSPPRSPARAKSTAGFG